MSLQKSFAGPLHQQVHDWLRSRILAGEWRDGGAIPGEVELSRDLGVSIGTVRKALDRLASDRIVVRERGRGTFVAGSPSHSGRGLQICDRTGAPVAPEIRLGAIGSDWATPAELAALKLRRKLGSSGVRIVRATRDWFHGGKLICHEEITVEAARFPGFESEITPDAPTFFEAYSTKYRTPVSRTVWTFGPRQPHDDEANGARADRAASPRLHWARIAYTARGVPIELCRQAFQLADEVLTLIV